jgi:osmotically-inducible protein OsmY
MKGVRYLLLGALGTVLLVASPAAAMTSGDRTVSDDDVRAAIEDQYLGDATVPFHAIEVGVEDGVVTLTGDVDTILARRRAVLLAREIKGVRSVVDRLEVKPSGRTDAEIRTDVVSALRDDPAADVYQIDPRVSDGVVTLEGTVDSWQEKEIATRVAENVRGVRDVRDEMQINYKTNRPDPEIEAEVRKRLEWDARVDDGLINIAVDHGKVTLSGAVGSALERANAESDAWVGGVKSVDATGLDVEWWARDRMRRETMATKTDAQIRQAVKDAFLYDPRVYSFEPDVSVSAGTVTLSGVVDNLQARRAAERDARDTVGVVMVRNHLRVRPATAATDEALKDRVGRALLLDSLVNRFDVHVTALDGRVYLTGEVDSRVARERAGIVASRVPGVVEVDNDLTVMRQAVWRSDHELERAIERRLVWSPYVDSGDVNVSVEDGVATLTGTVDSSSERSWAGEDAREAGAHVVVNELKVRQEGAAWLPS